MSTNPASTSNARLSAEHITAYQRDGVILLPGVVDAERVKKLLAAADQQLDAFQAQQRSLARNLADGGGTFLSQRHAYLQQPEFERLIHDSDLAALAGQLMGAQQVRFYFDHLFMLDSDTAKDRYRWHQDQPYWACSGDQVCTFWMALTDCDVDSGALEFVLGSDHGPLYPPAKVWHPGDATPHAELPRTPAYHQQRDQYRIVSWPVKAGDCLAFNGRIVHSARGNHSSDKRRVAYATRWFGEALRYARHEHYQDPLTFPEAEILPGQALARSSRFPLIWQNDDGLSTNAAQGRT
ncbi:phytanoyl-CoA dioxygenase family protein [Pseudomonas sp. LRF_L74]|uniref:phytanoyl-CoA dioxygenase family protein n=1 Tax=Pseudomonas sp. LRF_L74 TaxID=3369422 RepID=UPI003F5E2F83